jgi:hypothetical protein
VSDKASRYDYLNVNVTSWLGCRRSRGLHSVSAWKEDSQDARARRRGAGAASSSGDRLGLELCGGG